MKFCFLRLITIDSRGCTGLAHHDVIPSLFSNHINNFCNSCRVFLLARNGQFTSNVSLSKRLSSFRILRTRSCGG